MESGTGAMASLYGQTKLPCKAHRPLFFYFFIPQHPKRPSLGQVKPGTMTSMGINQHTKTGKKIQRPSMQM